MQGGEHDEAISIYPLQMRVRRLLRRHCPSTPPPTMTPRNDDSEVFQQSLKRESSIETSLDPCFRRDDELGAATQ